MCIVQEPDEDKKPSRWYAVLSNNMRRWLNGGNIGLFQVFKR